MLQTFNDLLVERLKQKRSVFGRVVWMLLETSVGIVVENIEDIMTRKMRIVRIAIVTVALLMIPLVAMQFTTEVNWSVFDFIVMGIMIFGAGLAYELISRRSSNTSYRIAIGIAVGAMFLLGWINGAVGLIGSENQPANLLYFFVFATAVIGAIATRLQPRGMSRAMYATAAVQLIVPVIALLIWPDVSWGAAGMFRIVMLNTIFATLFVISALLFHHASAATTRQV